MKKDKASRFLFVKKIEIKEMIAIAGFILEIILGLCIIGDPLWQLVSSPFYLTIAGSFFTMGYIAYKCVESKDKFFEKVGVGVILFSIITFILLICSSQIRESTAAFIGMTPPQVSFKHVSWLQWTVWIILNMIINGITMPKTGKKEETYINLEDGSLNIEGEEKTDDRASSEISTPEEEYPQK